MPEHALSISNATLYTIAKKNWIHLALISMMMYIQHGKQENEISVVAVVKEKKGI